MGIPKKRGRKKSPKYQGNFLLCKGEQELAEGTIEEIAKERKVNVNTIKYYLTDSYKRKVAKTGNSDKRVVLIPLDYDLPDE